MSAFARLAIRAIRSYRERGGGERILNTECCFEPSCSRYTEQAILERGLLRGIIIGFRRIRRCRDRDAVSRIVDPLD